MEKLYRKGRITLFIVYKHENTYPKAINLSTYRDLFISTKGNKFVIKASYPDGNNPIDIIERSSENEILQDWNSLMASIEVGDSTWKSPDLD